jgi:hypothetical protein
MQQVPPIVGGCRAAAMQAEMFFIWRAITLEWRAGVSAADPA